MVCPGPRVTSLSVGDAQRVVLEGWLRCRATAQALAQWSRIVLGVRGGALGHGGVAPAADSSGDRSLRRAGLDGLCDGFRPGVPRKITDADVERVIVETLEETPRQPLILTTGMTLRQSKVRPRGGLRGNPASSSKQT